MLLKINGYSDVNYWSLQFTITHVIMLAPEKADCGRSGENNFMQRSSRIINIFAGKLCLDWISHLILDSIIFCDIVKETA